MTRSRLRAERERRGWTLEYVAAQVGVSGVQVSRIENTGVKASETALALRDLFGGDISLEEICAAREEGALPAEQAAQ